MKKMESGVFDHSLADSLTVSWGLAVARKVRLSSRDYFTRRDRARNRDRFPRLCSRYGSAFLQLCVVLGFVTRHEVTDQILRSLLLRHLAAKRHFFAADRSA